ncbi:MAG: DUF917 family protein [Paracoccus sp. (in: a-proteobacteria)]|nr:DUF917 family protein [Paracoccus sp. (in: a-proteobacteria)]
MQPTRMIAADDVETLALGAAVLACGSGGDPQIGALLARLAIAQHGPVPLIAADALPDDALVVPAGMLGDPAILSEKPPQGDELVQALHVLERALNRPAAAVVCAGSFGLNLTLALSLAAAARLPIIDGDGTGRAMPGLRASGLALTGVSATPMVLCDDKGNNLTIETVSDDWADRLARTASAEMGGAAMMTLYPMTGAQTRTAVIRDTVSLSTRLGTAMRSDDAPAAALARMLDGQILTTGRVLRLHPGQVWIGAADGNNYEVRFSDVLSGVTQNGQPLAVAPQGIALIDPVSARPVPVAGLMPDQRISVLAWPAAPVWSSAAGLAMARTNGIAAPQRG